MAAIARVVAPEVIAKRVNLRQSWSVILRSILVGFTAVWNRRSSRL